MKNRFYELINVVENELTNKTINIIMQINKQVCFLKFSAFAIVFCFIHIFNSQPNNKKKMESSALISGFEFFSFCPVEYEFFKLV